MDKFPVIDTAQLKEIVEEYISWNRGEDFKWQGMALTDADFMLQLVTLAAKAPSNYKRAFCKWLADGDEL